VLVVENRTSWRSAVKKHPSMVAKLRGWQAVARGRALGEEGAPSPASRFHSCFVPGHCVVCGVWCAVLATPGQSLWPARGKSQKT
jgi:hypothetical protein